KELLKEMLQASILVLVRISIDGQEISWMRFVSRNGENLVDPPFPFPSLLVRKLAPQANLALHSLYGLLAERFSESAPAGVEVFPDVPAFCFHSNPPISLQLSTDADFTKVFTKWDAQILMAEKPKFLDENRNAEYARHSDYIGLFQRATQDEVFFATDVS